MTNEQALSAILGIVMPAVISFLKNVNWTARRRFWFAVVCCAIAGTATAYFTGGLTFTWGGAQKALLDIAIIFSTSQAVYKGWFEGTAIDKRLTGG